MGGVFPLLMLSFERIKIHIALKKAKRIITSKFFHSYTVRSSAQVAKKGFRTHTSKPVSARGVRCATVATGLSPSLRQEAGVPDTYDIESNGQCNKTESLKMRTSRFCFIFFSKKDKIKESKEASRKREKRSTRALRQHNMRH